MWCSFWQRRGFPIPSPAVVNRMGRFRDGSAGSPRATGSGGALRKADRKIDVMSGHLARKAATAGTGGRDRGGAQEFQRVATCAVRQARYGGARTSGGSGLRPAFVKFCAYFPNHINVWLNGYEWAERQAAKAGICFTELGNRFAACDDPTALQAISDRLLRGTITGVLQLWIARLPLPTRPGLCPSLALRRPTCHGRPSA
jgi:hypothetical protein